MSLAGWVCHLEAWARGERLGAVTSTAGGRIEIGELRLPAKFGVRRVLVEGQDVHLAPDWVPFMTVLLNGARLSLQPPLGGEPTTFAEHCQQNPGLRSPVQVATPHFRIVLDRQEGALVDGTYRPPAVDVARMAARVSILCGGRVVAEGVVAPGAELSVGSAEGCSVTVPEEVGVERLVMLEAGARLLVCGAWRVTADVEADGARFWMSAEHEVAAHPHAARLLQAPVTVVGDRLKVHVPTAKGDVCAVVRFEPPPS